MRPSNKLYSWYVFIVCTIQCRETLHYNLCYLSIQLSIGQNLVHYQNNPPTLVLNQEVTCSCHVGTSSMYRYVYIKLPKTNHLTRIINIKYSTDVSIIYFILFTKYHLSIVYFVITFSIETQTNLLFKS